jgi:hypothetical protein
LDDHQNDEDDESDDVIPPDNEGAERTDDIAGKSLAENEPRGRDIEGKAKQREDQQQASPNT